MASKTLAEKLYIRPGYTVALLNAPQGAGDLLAPLPDEVTLVTSLQEEKATEEKAAEPKASEKKASAKGGKSKASKEAESAQAESAPSDPAAKRKIDLVLSFVKSAAELEAQTKELKDALNGEEVLWFAYPKLSSKTASDLTRDKGWGVVYDQGFVGIASVAIDEVWSALRFKRRLAQSNNEMVAKLFAGERAQYLPLYDHLLSILSGLGPDVEVAPRQSYIAFARGKQFALLMPTKDRLDLVLKMPSVPLRSRLIPAPGLGSGSMTHRVPITQPGDIDTEMLGWIREAYRGVNR